MQALVEAPVKASQGQGLQTCWKTCAIQAVVEVPAKSQGLQTCLKGDTVQALVEPAAKAKVCKPAGRLTPSKNQGLQTCWKSDTVQACSQRSMFANLQEKLHHPSFG